MNFGYLPAKTVEIEFATSNPCESLSIRALSVTLFAKCIFCQKFQPPYHFPTYHLLFGTSLWCFQVYIRRWCTAGKRMLLGFKRFFFAPCYTCGFDFSCQGSHAMSNIKLSQHIDTADMQIVSAQTGRTGKVLPQVCFIAHPQLSGTKGPVHGDSCEET